MIIRIGDHTDRDIKTLIHVLIRPAIYDEKPVPEK